MKQIDTELLKRLIDNEEYLYFGEYKALFSDRYYVEDIMEYVSSVQAEHKENEKERKKYLQEFVRKLSVAGHQISFLRAVIIYIEDRLNRESLFSDYEHAIRYSCIAAAGLNDLEHLEENDKEKFFENLRIGIRYAGEKGQKGYAYNGKEEIRKYTFLLTGTLVKEIAVRNFVLDADSIIKKVSNNNMVYFVQNSCMKAEEKERYKKIDRLLVKKCYTSLGLLADSLEKVFEGYVLTNFTGEDMEGWQQIMELQERKSEDRVRVWGKLDVWKCSIYYKVVNEKHGYYLTDKKVLELVFGINWDDEKEVWRDISNSNPLLFYTQSEEADMGEIVCDVMNYIASWAERSISDSVQEKGLEIICFWHDDIKERNVAENIVKIKGGFGIEHEREGNMHIFIVNLLQKNEEQNHYWIQNEDVETIKSINILLGRNGSGKTSTMMLLRYDGLEANAKEGVTKFFIVYKRGADCFYSTNLREAEYDIRGNILKKGKRNISEYRGQKNRVIYYSYVLQPYEEKTELMAPNTIDISNQYIRDMEIGNMSMEEMIHTDSIYGEKRKAFAQRKRDYNQDNIRQLQFLHDIGDKFDEKESWMPDYVKKFVIVRGDINNTDKIIEKYIKKAGFRNELTGFWEYREWRVYYHNSVDLEKIINFCKHMIEKEEILYFEMRLPQMSSGEKARLTLFSRLHAWIRQMTPLDFRQNNILLLDELEAFMHPEWQRCMIYDLIRFFEWEHRKGKPIKVQLFISSNSPFLISDVDMDEITVMDEKIKLDEKTFAQNIHVILKDSFFQKSGFMGEYARQKVDYVYKILSCCLEKRNKDILISDEEEKAAKECSNIIEKIGEPLIYNDLREMYEEIFHKEKYAESSERFKEMPLEELKRQIKAAQNELKRRRK